MQPEVRFSEYVDNWEQRKLGEIADVTKLAGFEFTKYISYLNEGRIIALRGLNVKNGQLILDEVKYIDHSDFTKLTRSKLYKDDILFTYVGTVGELAVVPENDKYYLAPNVARIRLFSNINPQFISQMMNNNMFYNKVIYPLIATSSQPALSMENLRKFTLNLPLLEEQQKIGTFFKQLDDTIALQQRQLERLKDSKQGFLQKMFPKDGERVPEVRFAGFSGDWEKQRLDNIADLVGGGTPSTNNSEFWHGCIDWYSPVEIGDKTYMYGSKKRITELGLQKSSAKILPIGTVLFTSRAGIGKTAILAKEGATNQGFQSIVPDKNKLDTYFIFSRSQELKHYGEVNGAGSTFVEVSGKQMAKMNILIPNMEEQQKIGAFFKKLDDTIALHEKELDLLKKTKKAFLQKMFI